MKKNNIDKTKRSLSIAFSVIVFITVFVMGFIYFSAKYINESRNERIEFYRFIDLIENRGGDGMNMGFGPRFEFTNAPGNGHHNGGIKVIQKPGVGAGIKGFVNYVIIQNGELIASEIRDNIPEIFITNSLTTDNYTFDTKEESGYLIRNIKTDTGKIYIFIKKLDYSFSDYYTDILGFILISLLFTIIVYFIGGRFVNKVFVPVEENLKDMNDFIHNAGHELKTPISVIDSNVQLMLDTKKFDNEMLLEIKEEGTKLNSLIESLLELSELDKFENTEDVNLNKIVNEVLTDFRTKIEEKKIEGKTDIGDNIIIKTNKSYFYIFLSNIIGNSIKYNKEGGEIKISYKGGKLTIKDTGIGMNEKEIHNIFERFYKIDKSRNSQGFGIGLSLVKKIAGIYDWGIDIESKEGKGTVFVIKF